jgi:hypothetical protein
MARRLSRRTAPPDTVAVRPQPLPAGSPAATKTSLPSLSGANIHNLRQFSTYYHKKSNKKAHSLEKSITFAA